jgi:hypothetical protein
MTSNNFISKQVKDIPTWNFSLSLNYNLKNAMVLGIIALAVPKRGQSNKYEHLL